MATRKTAAKKTSAKSTPRAAGGRPRVKGVNADAEPRGAATPSELRRIARSIVTATTVNDEKRIFGLYHPAVESTEAGQKPATGLDALKAKFEGFAKTCSSSTWAARNMWVDGQSIIIEWDATLTLRPSGKKVPFHEIAIYEIRGGKIIRERYFYDPAQLGGR
jgi:ketosteroid isomerase-like protein